MVRNNVIIEEASAGQITYYLIIKMRDPGEGTVYAFNSKDEMIAYITGPGRSKWTIMQFNRQGQYEQVRLKNRMRYNEGEIGWINERF